MLEKLLWKRQNIKDKKDIYQESNPFKSQVENKQDRELEKSKKESNKHISFRKRNKGIKSKNSFIKRKRIKRKNKLSKHKQPRQ